LTNVIGVRFKSGGKIYYFDPAGLDMKQDDCVIVETSRGVEYASVAAGNHQVPDESVVAPLKQVIRIATDDDKRHIEENAKKEKEAADVCNRKIAEHKLDMKLIDVEYTFDNSKILFYFTADGRVDFRELVKDLAGIFRTRIELRQIGVRDEAKMLGGLGVCGRELCCSSFLGDFQPVSIKMAKEQGLSLNPTKISGTCGRLMCCLKYEQAAYDSLIKITPKLGATVDTPSGVGTVCELNMISGVVKVRFSDENENISFKSFNRDEVRVIPRVKEARAPKNQPAENPDGQNG